MLFHGEPVELSEYGSNMIVFLWPTKDSTGKMFDRDKAKKLTARAK